MDKVVIKVKTMFSTSMASIEINDVVITNASDKFVKPFIEGLEKVFQTLDIPYEIVKDYESCMADMWWD